VVEGGGFGGAGRANVVMRGDGVEELGAELRGERARMLLDQAQPELDVAEQAPFRGRREYRRRSQLERAPEIVSERGGEQQVGTQARMELAEIARDGGDADGVLEQPARVAVVAVHGRGKSAQAPPSFAFPEQRRDGRAKGLVRDFGEEEVEESLQLIGVAAAGRCERRRIGLGRRLERAHLDLQLVAEALDPTHDAHRIALRKAGIEQVDVVPDARLDATALVAQLEREVGSSGSRAQAFLAGDGIDAVYGAVRDQLGERGHALRARFAKLFAGVLGHRVTPPPAKTTHPRGRETVAEKSAPSVPFSHRNAITPSARVGRSDQGLRGLQRPYFGRKALVESSHKAVGTLLAMADVKSFKALTFDTEIAGPLERLVAPPYDVIDAEARAGYLARSPHNIVNLTLPEDENDSGPLLASWREQGVLYRDAEPALWWLEQSFVGPDGVARRREGFLASIKVEPYANKVVLPHERTHSGPKQSRLRLLTATRTQIEPIFLLYDDPGRCEQALREQAAGREPDFDVEELGVRSRLWRVDDTATLEKVQSALADKQLLIADGHHRYETAVAFHEQEGTEASAYTFAALVNTRGEGLAIFPTHRVYATAPELGLLAEGEPRNDVEPALKELEGLSYDTAAVLVYDKTGVRLAVTDEPVLDVELVGRLGHQGISYTPDWKDAVAAVDSGAAEVSVLMRPSRIDQVFAVAREGRVMPQKSTYFYPKLLSGLVLYPL
jgi:uncharacterized protein (DUF1015 family)